MIMTIAACMHTSLRIHDREPRYAWMYTIYSCQLAEARALMQRNAH